MIRNFFLVALIAICTSAFAQVKPNAPSSLCISDSEGLSGCSALKPSGTKKWNPGHYVRPNAVGFQSNAADRKNSFERVRSESLIKGGIISAPWGSIEPQPGVYNFAPIDADLAVMKSMGKKLIIEVWWQKYDSNPNDTRYFPQYMLDQGGVHDSGNNSWSVNMNERKWMDRYLALQKALAARYDKDPDVEQTVITETASSSAVLFKEIVPAVAAMWPNTQVILYANYVDTPELARDLLAIGAPLGVGIGSPDIIGPSGMSDEDHGSKALRGVGVSSYWGAVKPTASEPTGDYGRIDYRGKIPVAYQYQAVRGVGAQRVIGYAVNELKATHLGWTMVDGGGETDWKYTLSAIKSHPTLVTAVPSLLAK